MAALLHCVTDRAGLFFDMAKQRQRILPPAAENKHRGSFSGANTGYYAWHSLLQNYKNWVTC